LMNIRKKLYPKGKSLKAGQKLKRMFTNQRAIILIKLKQRGMSDTTARPAILPEKSLSIGH